MIFPRKIEVFFKKGFHFEPITDFMIFVSKDFWSLGKQNKGSAHQICHSFLPKKYPRKAPLLGIHGSKIIVQHMVNLRISDLQGSYGTKSPEIRYY